VVNGHKSAAHTDTPDCGTDKTCLGEGMHCPTASSLSILLLSAYIEHSKFIDVDVLKIFTAQRMLARYIRMLWLRVYMSVSLGVCHTPTPYRNG